MAVKFHFSFLIENVPQRFFQTLNINLKKFYPYIGIILRGNDKVFEDPRSLASLRALHLFKCNTMYLLKILIT